MPDVIWPPGRNHMAERTFIISWIRDSLFFEDSANGRCLQVQVRSAEGVGDSDLSHGGTQGLEPLYKVADEVRIPVDWPWKLKQCGRPALIEAGRPGSNGRRRDPESVRGLHQRPAPSDA